MTACDLDIEALYAWVDGEAGVRTERISAHQARCTTCRSRLQALHAIQSDLGQHMEASAPTLDPLIALQHIRQHPALGLKRRWAGPGRDAWEFAWGVHRGRCVAGLLTSGVLLTAVAWAALIL